MTFRGNHICSCRAINRLTTASASLAHDAEGRLRQTAINGVVTTLLHDGPFLIAARTWFHADHLGSIVAQSNGTGTATAKHAYGPYGEPGTAAGQSLPERFGYTGQQYLAGLNLYHYKARTYSPTLGRFIETDPLGIPDGTNRYAYVGNNPVNFTDPSGFCLQCVGAIYGGVAGLVGGAISGYATNGSVLDAAKGAGLGLFAGAATGAFAPWLSNQAGAAAAAVGLARTVGTVAATATVGGISSAVGQLSGNVVTGQPMGTEFSWGAVGGSAVGAPLAMLPAKIVGSIAATAVGTSVPFGSRSLTIVTPTTRQTGSTFQAFTEGAFGGVFEAGGQAIENMLFPATDTGGASGK